MLCDLMLTQWQNNTRDAPLFPKIDQAIKLKEAGASDAEVRNVLTDEDICQARQFLKRFEDSPMLCGGRSIPFDDVGKFQDMLRTAQKFSLTSAFTRATLKRLATPETIIKAKEWFALIHDPMWLEWQMDGVAMRLGALLYSRPTVNGDPAIMCYFLHGMTGKEMNWFELYHFRLFPDSLRQDGDHFKMDIENESGATIAEVDFEHMSTMLIFDFIVRLNSKRITDFRPPEDLSRINKKRAKLGRLPLCSYQIVDLNNTIKLHLKQAGEESTYGMRFHWRRGHFKVRRTGIFWWNPHTAGRKAHGEIHKDYIA